MSIYAYVGLPGSGKSYGVVANQIIPALRAGRRVVTNIPLHIDQIRKDFPVADDQITDFPVEKIAGEPELIEEYCKPGDVVIIDELWRLFPAGQKVDRVPAPFKSFLAEHRHRVDEQGRSMQIVFVTQDLAQIAAFARDLVEQTFVHTKLGFLGMSGSYKCEIFNKSVKGPNPPQSQKIRTVHGSYRKNIYAYYKSHTMSNKEGDGADETVVDTRANIWKRPVIWVGAAFVLVALPWSVFAVTDYFTPEKPAARLPAGASGATAGGSAQLPRGGWKVEPEKPPKVWRVAMVLQASEPSESVAQLVDDAGDRVWISGKDCMFTRMQWRCRYLNKWWVQTGVYRAPEADSRPLGDAPLSSALLGAGS